MRKPEVSDFFARLIQRVAPKSYAQAMGEHVVTRRFFGEWTESTEKACAQATARGLGPFMFSVWYNSV